MQNRHPIRSICALAVALYLAPTAAAQAQATVTTGSGATVTVAPGATVGKSGATTRRARSDRGSRWRGPGRRAHRPRDRGYPYFAPVVPFVFGFEGPYLDDYPVTAGRCAYWHRRCVARWGYGGRNYYGCMRYYGC